MKKGWMLGMVAMAFLACNNSAAPENRADSLGREADTLNEKVRDSGKKDIMELNEKIEKEFEEKDSTKN